MTRIVLVHGSNHGAWCWDRLLPELARHGHEGVAIDLPAMGDDPADPSAVTLDDCARRVAGAIAPGDLVVAHSLGGISATVGADRRAGEVAGLVYLAAWVPRPGLPLSDYRTDGATPALLSVVRRGPVPDTTVFDPRDAPAIFYPDCPEDADRALTRHRPQPVSVMTTPVHLSSPPPPRFYIRCLRDRAIDPAYQRRVSQDWPPTRVFDLDCGHSPFLSCPDRLADTLDVITKALP